MHYHCEIIMPPTDDVEATVAKVLAPFMEEGTDENGYANQHTFWNWYVVGGRWTGNKLLQTLGRDKVQSFREELRARNVTVHGLIWGKPELSPAGQKESVDQLWREWFPDSPMKECPLFKDAGDMPGDIMPLKDVDRSMTAGRVIIATFFHGRAKAEFMIEQQFWNGVTHVDTTWDGTIGSALDMNIEKHEGYTEEYKEASTPQDDWLVVTVDYHS
jgi:hypothetical protein